MTLVSALSCDFREQPENGPGPVQTSGRKGLDFGDDLLSPGVSSADDHVFPPPPQVGPVAGEESGRPLN